MTLLAAIADTVAVEQGDQGCYAHIPSVVTSINQVVYRYDFLGLLRLYLFT